MLPGFGLKRALYFSSLLLLCQATEAKYSEAENRPVREDGIRLDSRAESVVAIAAYSAIGDLQCLKTELRLGLETGLTIQESREILLQIFPYCGYPRSLNALGVLSEIVGPSSQTETNAQSILDNKTRELVAISSLAAMDGTEPQLKAHFNQAKSAGFSLSELKSFVEFLGNLLGESKARVAEAILAEAQQTTKGS